MRDLQDEVDTESGILPDVKLPVLSRAPTGAKILKKLVAKTRQQIAGDAAWALSLLVSDNTENQNKARWFFSLWIIPLKRSLFSFGAHCFSGVHSHELVGHKISPSFLEKRCSVTAFPKRIVQYKSICSLVSCTVSFYNLLSIDEK